MIISYMVACFKSLHMGVFADDWQAAGTWEILKT
jgi:hypothetical protein